jgi:phage antirepressor YoqD-like protein
MIMRTNANYAAKNVTRKGPIPNAKFPAALTDADAVDIRETARVLRCGSNDLMALLRLKGILTDSDLPAQKFLDQGYFRIAERAYPTAFGFTCSWKETLVCKRGLEFVSKLIGGIQSARCKESSEGC